MSARLHAHRLVARGVGELAEAQRHVDSWDQAVRLARAAEVLVRLRLGVLEPTNDNAEADRDGH